MKKNNLITIFEDFYIYRFSSANELPVFQPCRRTVSWRARCSSWLGPSYRHGGRNTSNCTPNLLEFCRQIRDSKGKGIQKGPDVSLGFLVACPEHVLLS